MGRLQYIHRKINGLKLGQVVAKDLLKRISSNTTHKAALRDPCIDLDVSGKGLDYNALAEITTALETLFENNCDDRVIVKVEELCFAGNALTTQSFGLLSRILRLAAMDLRDLDLSNNKFSVETVDDTCLWEDFLEALSSCTALRRVDLSGSPLGAKAFEVLAKVYARQKRTPDSFTFDTNGSETKIGDALLEEIASNPSASAAGGFSESHDARGSPCHESTSFNGSLHPKEEIADELLQDQPVEAEQRPTQNHVRSSPGVEAAMTQAGMQAIPYLVFDSTCMDDTCALHLSHVVEKHRLPGRLLPLVPSAKAGAPFQQLSEYDQDPLCRGIMYRENESIGNNGGRVLELAEKARDRAMRQTSSGFEEPSLSKVLGPDLTSVLHMPGTSGLRRKSNVSAGGSEAGQGLIRSQDLGTARSKIQAEALKHGLRQNDLWYSAIRMLNLARAFLSHPSHEKFPSRGHVGFRGKAGNRAVQHVAESLSGMRVSTSPDRSRALSIMSTNMPIVPHPHYYNHPSLPISASGKHVRTIPATLSTKTIQLFQRPYRSSLPYGLTARTWGRILAQATDTEDVLGVHQQEAVVQWAFTKETILQERAELGKLRANQIWLVLNGMGCLAYDS